MQTATTKFNIIEIEPLYESSDNIGPRKKVVVGLGKTVSVCNLCGSRWEATEADKADARHFYRYGLGIQLMCAACGESDTIALRPLLAQAKGQHIVVLGTEGASSGR